MSRVDLGYAESCESWQVASYQFPSKIGGRPAWLALENLPSTLQCDVCHEPLTFLLQIYAPIEEDPQNFHRTVYVFICRDPKCCLRSSSSNIKVLRNSLPRCNSYYSSEPPRDGEDPHFSVAKWTKLCNLCGCFAEKHCAKCKDVAYCSKVHQVLDWKEGHKVECEKGAAGRRTSAMLFKEFELVIEAEGEAGLGQKNINEAEELKKFKEMEKEGRIGTLGEIPEEEMDKYALCDDDKIFQRFKDRIKGNEEQVLRYERGGEPLWITKEPRAQIIPDCEYCGGHRQFEFQIMPQLLSILRENELDIGVIAVYTCSKSCTQGDCYKKEFVFKQDIATNSL